MISGWGKKAMLGNRGDKNCIMSMVIIDRQREMMHTDKRRSSGLEKCMCKLVEPQREGILVGLCQARSECHEAA